MSAGGPQKQQWLEQIELAGDQLVRRVEALIHEGNVRHIRIKHSGHVVLEVPMTLAVAGGLLAPVQAALAAFAAAVTHCTVEVVREETDPGATPPAIPTSSP
jgi:Domain of unknown function (DUF4342)